MNRIILALGLSSLCVPPSAPDPPPNAVPDRHKAARHKPPPLVFGLHGGGWVRGENQPVGAANYLKAGISVVSIQYRFTTDAVAEGQWPPVEWPLHDAARALQTV